MYNVIFINYVLVTTSSTMADIRRYKDLYKQVLMKTACKFKKIIKLGYILFGNLSTFSSSGCLLIEIT